MLKNIIRKSIITLGTAAIVFGVGVAILADINTAHADRVDQVKVVSNVITKAVNTKDNIVKQYFKYSPAHNYYKHHANLAKNTLHKVDEFKDNKLASKFVRGAHMYDVKRSIINTNPILREELYIVTIDNPNVGLYDILVDNQTYFNHTKFVNSKIELYKVDDHMIYRVGNSYKKFKIIR